MGYNVLFFPWRDWNQMKVDGFRTREANILISMINNPEIEQIICINRSKIPPYIKTLLALRNRKFFSNSGTPQKKEDYLNLNNEKVISNRLFSQLKQINDKLYVLDIDFHIPNPKGNILERFLLFEKILLTEIQETLKIVNVKDYITWCFDITRIKIAEKFKKSVMIFDAIDNLLEHDQKKNDYEYLSEMYQFAIEYSDIIFTVSKDLKQSIFSNHNRTYYIPNAINLEAYKQKISSQPADLPKNKPIIGYVGLLQERIDTEILELSIKQNENANFVFIGPVISKSYFKGIEKYPNVYFLGSKHHSMIPSYIHHFDVSLIPHKVNNFTKSMNPLKLYEYLAAGKEIVTTRVPPSDEYQHVLHICDNKEEFSQKIKQCIETPFRHFKQEEIFQAIQSEDWNERLKEMLIFVEELNYQGKVI